LITVFKKKILNLIYLGKLNDKYTMKKIQFKKYFEKAKLSLKQDKYLNKKAKNTNERLDNPLN
jgi:hypothetical protein